MGKRYVIGLIICLNWSNCTAQDTLNQSGALQPDTYNDFQGPVEARASIENNLQPNHFAITFYKPTYILPYYYTGSPYESIYVNNTPDNEQIQRYEVKFQLSFKVPVVKSLFRDGTNVYIAYTQLSYWQAYNHTAFFRSTNYEPEFFVANEINWRLTKNLHINFLNVGIVHASNGHGGDLERSWNRIYLEAISEYDNFMVSIKPWYIIHDQATQKYNSNIGDYLGYGELTIAYKYHNQVLSLQAHSLFEQHSRRITGEFTWSFPLTAFINAYVDVFSGYGQSLIEYDHRTNSAGIGISLSNWI